MKPKLFVFLLLLAFVCCKQESGPQSKPVHWVLGPTVGRLDLLAIDFIDSERGWAVGDIDPAGTGGAIAATTDGGRSWHVLARTTEVIASIHFVSPSRGWIAGYAGRIERTDDGGRTWKVQRIERESEALNSIFFIDDRRGWAVGGGAGQGGLLLRTTDGGDTWETISTGRVEDFWAVRFSSIERGWTVGEDGLILATTDGGKNWVSQASGTSQGLLGLAVVTSGLTLAVGEGGVILRSEDGALWTAIGSGTDETLSSVAAAGPDIFWAVGTGGATVGSSDGGRTWTAAALPGSRNMMAIDLTGQAHGTAVGQLGFTQLLQH